MRKESRLTIPAVKRLIRWKNLHRQIIVRRLELLFIFSVCVCLGKIGAPCYQGYLTEVRFLRSTRGLIYLFPLFHGSKQPAPNFCRDVARGRNSHRKCEHFCGAAVNQISRLSSSGPLKHLCPGRDFIPKKLEWMDWEDKI